MDEASRWRENIRNGYVLAQIYYAWSRTGVLSALRRAGKAGASAQELAAAAGVSERLLAPTLYYVTYADGVLRKEGELYALTDQGAAYLEASFENSLLAFVGAYGCVLQELEPSLRGERVYGVDFERRGDLLALASFGATRGNFPFIVETMRRQGIRYVVDLGCGAAGVLIEMCRLDEGLRGLGIDISPAAIEQARARVKQAGLSDRIELVVGDVAEVDGWGRALELPEAAALHCTGVLHEFLRDGEEAVVRLFQRMREAFPKRLFFMGEFNGRTEADYRALGERLERTKDLWYQDLIHPLTKQGMPQPRSVWLRILQRAGVELLDVQDFRHNVYVLRL
jgi:SAM-dependent methyltransferase